MKLVTRWRVFIFALLLAGAAFRLVYLGRASYQIDELATMQMWRDDKTVSAIFNHALNDLSWNHRMVVLPIINMYLLKGHTGPAPLPSEWAARLPHAILGIFALPLFYLLGLRLRDRSTGAWSLGLASFSIFAVYYAREAYDYSAVFFFSTATLLTGLQALQSAVERRRGAWWWSLGYMVSTTGLLMTHLSGLLFIAPLSALVLVAATRQKGWKAMLSPQSIVYWVATLGCCFFAFLPFLFRLMSGYTNMDTAASQQHFSLSVVPAVLGRMGWGEGLPALLPFVAALAAGTWISVRSWRDRRSSPALVVVLVAVVYFAFQSYALRVARAETRYYMPILPCLIALAAVGLETIISGVAAKLPRLSKPVVRGVIAMALAAWLLPSLWYVCRLQCRGYNYKGIAAWINQHVPDNGVYAFYNVYELRGVPGVYPTPGRFGTSVAVWSTSNDFERVNPPQRLRSLIARFPQTYFVEIAPDDLLTPQIGTPPLPRDELFAQHEWLVDDAWESLIRLETFPPGQVQLGGATMERALISYSVPGDMAKMAVKRGEPLFHYFGPEWQYARDQQYNDWLHIQQFGSIFIGNTTREPIPVNITLITIAPPQGCRLNVYSPRGGKLLDHAEIPPSVGQTAIQNFQLPPGSLEFTFEVLPPPGAMSAELYLHEVRIQPASP